MAWLFAYLAPCLARFAPCCALSTVLRHDYDSPPSRATWANHARHAETGVAPMTTYPWALMEAFQMKITSLPPRCAATSLQ